MRTLASGPASALSPKQMTLEGHLVRQVMFIQGVHIGFSGKEGAPFVDCPHTQELHILGSILAPCFYTFRNPSDHILVHLFLRCWGTLNPTCVCMHACMYACTLRRTLQPKAFRAGIPCPPANTIVGDTLEQLQAALLFIILKSPVGCRDSKPYITLPSPQMRRNLLLLCTSQGMAVQQEAGLTVYASGSGFWGRGLGLGV